MIKGLGVSEGIAIGKAIVIAKNDLIIEQLKVSDIEQELNKLDTAITIADKQIEVLKNKVEKKLGKEKAEIFEAHRLILSDPEFINEIKNKIKNDNINVEFAVKTTIQSFLELFDVIDDPYMRERASDIKDVGDRLLRVLTNTQSYLVEEINNQGIIIANDLTRSETAQIDTDFVLGFATDIGGSTSHSAIMARNLEIPAVVGTKNITNKVKTNDLLIIDGSNGEIIINPSDDLIEKYKKAKEAYELNKQALFKYRDKDVVTLDNKSVEVFANIGSLDNAKKAVKVGSQGVGLFRTEFVYMDRDDMPSEEEQFEIYKDITITMQNKPLIIRTLDIGGDKKLSYLKIDEEMNPFLGYRAIRLCLDRKDIFKSQLRAILRASAFGNVEIMFPMISNLEELIEAKNELEAAKQELREQNIDFDNEVKVGIMIEIPSAALMSDILAQEVDFFSIGTNDLIQYTTAVDRMNEKVSYLYNPLNPGVLRLIKLVIDNAHKYGKKVGMCGETAGDSKLIPIYLGFGLDEFSMSTSSVLKAKEQLSNLNYSKCKLLSEQVLSMKTTKEIEDAIDVFLKDKSQIS